MAEKKTAGKPHCGIVMPISDIDGCSTSHWAEVKQIIIEAAEMAGFTSKLVSDSEDIGVIQGRIVQALHDADIIVCDVSAKNANVMFELGLRLAFDKPVVILKDNKTNYSFDTSPLEHLDYPRDLRYSEILNFKDRLSAKIEKTLEASKLQGYKSFLSHFGKFHVSGLKTEEIGKEDFILKEISAMRRQLMELAIDRSSLFNEPRNSLNTLREMAHRGRMRDTLIRATLEKLITDGTISPGEVKKFDTNVYRAVFKENNEILDLFDGDAKQYEETVERIINDFQFKSKK